MSNTYRTVWILERTAATYIGWHHIWRKGKGETRNTFAALQSLQKQLCGGLEIWLTEHSSKYLQLKNTLFTFVLDSSIDVPLQVIEIYFDTGTYDNIERDVKVTINAQLGLIGGTMGLLTGFSILSAAEIVYYIGRFVMSAKLFKTVKSTEAEKLHTKERKKESDVLSKMDIIDILRDFLESSTIHGLQYISRVQVVVVLKKKVNWKKNIFT